MRKDYVQAQNDKDSVQNSCDTAVYTKRLKAGVTSLQKGVSHGR